MTELEVLQSILVSIWVMGGLIYYGLYLVSEEIRELREET